MIRLFSKEKSYTKAQFKDGTALTTLGTTYYMEDTNGGYPILKWQAE